MLEPKIKNANIASSDITQERLQTLKGLFPDLFDHEGNLDEAALKALVHPNTQTLDRFRFEWAGKQESKRFAFKPSRATLIADKDRSIDFDTTQNMIIEGDNLEVLKLLRQTYFEQVKCIYIDPPYNTGHDFIYPDNFTEGKKAYWQKNGTIKDGVKLQAVTESSGRKHSNWLNMMQSRLLLAQQLLREDGVIFISIDDNEQANLKKLCDEIFGEENFIATFPWRKRTAKTDVPYGVSQDYEWVLGYSKSYNFYAGVSIERKYHISDDYPNDRWRLSDLTTQKIEADRPNSAFDLVNPKNGKIYPYNPNRLWGITKDTFQNYYDKGKIVFPEDYDFLKITIPAYRVFESEDTAKNIKKNGSDVATKSVSTSFPKTVGMTESGTKEMTDIFGQKTFPFPKPTSLIKHLLETINEPSSIILDFFAGSGTTAHAVMQLNAEDGGTRKYICVQIPEYTDEKTEAFKAGYKTISQLCIERVKRAGDKIKAENPDKAIDTGFRVYKLTDSHFPENFFTSDPEKSEADNLTALDEHLKQASQKTLFDKNNLANIITEISLKNGYGLFFTLEDLNEFDKNTVYILTGNDKSTLLCLDDTLHEKTVDRLIDKYSTHHLIFSKHAVDTAKKWLLHNAFTDNMQVV
jgi:adenine-specific DNA-methyltransferase